MVRVASRASGRGTREAGSAGNCESTLEADNSAVDISSSVEEAEARATRRGTRAKHGDRRGIASSGASLRPRDPRSGIGRELRVDATRPTRVFNAATNVLGGRGRMRPTTRPLIFRRRRRRPTGNRPIACVNAPTAEAEARAAYVFTSLRFACTLIRIPRPMNRLTSAVPPNDTSGSGTPTIGSNPLTIAMLTKA
jgi:hypothetical protein